MGLRVGWLSSLILKGLVPLNGQSRRIREGISSLPTPGSSTSGPNLQGRRAVPLVCGYLCCVQSFLVGEEVQLVIFLGGGQHINVIKAL